MKIACSTSAFRGSLDDALAQVAALGFAAVDLICIPAWNHIVPADVAANFEAQAARIESLLRQHRLQPVAMNLAVANPHQRADAAVNAQRLAEVAAIAKLMKRLGVQVASFYPGYLVKDRPWEDVLRDEITTIREMLEAADGVTLAVELHAQTPFETVEQGRRLLAAIPDLPVAYDPSHFVMQGIPLPATAEFLDRAVHVHVRDAAPGQMCVPTGGGAVDFAWLLAALRRRHYRGAVSIECLPGLAEISQTIIRLRDRCQAFA